MVERPLRFKAEQETDLPLGTTVKGTIRPAKHEMMNTRRMKAPCSSQAQVHPLGRHICGTHPCFLDLCHHRAKQQVEMFLTEWSESCCFHGFPQHCDALSASKWGYHPLSALEWGEKPWTNLITCCSASTGACTSCEELDNQSFTLPQFPHLKNLYFSQTYCNKII